jgi:hypothetical protein
MTYNDLHNLGFQNKLINDEQSHMVSRELRATFIHTWIMYFYM